MADTENYIPEEDLEIDVRHEVAPGFTELEVISILSSIRKTERPVAFEIETGGSISCQPIRHNGRIYFGACDHNFYCLDKNGKEIWRFGTQAPIAFDFEIKNDIIYFGCFDKNMYALTLDGKLIWKFGTDDMIGSKPKVVDGVLYFGSKDHSLYALDAKTGSLIWKFRTGDIVCADPEVYEGKVYFGSWDRNVYCLDAKTGSLIWKYAANDTVGSVLEYRGYLFFGSFDHYFRSITPDGKLRWEFQAKGPILGAFDHTAANGLVYFGSRDRHLYALDAETGKLVWKFAADEMIMTAPIYNRGVIYTGSGNGNVYALDARTGKVIWKKSFKLPAIALSAYGNRLYFGCWDCNLYALDPEGNELWKFQTSLGYPSQVNLEPEYQNTVETVWKVPERKKDKKIYTDEVQTGDYGDFSGAYVDVTKMDYLKSKKKNYVKKEEHSHFR